MKAILFALLGGLCWGVGEFFTKQVLLSGKIGPWAVVMVRIVAVVPLAVLAYWLATSVLKSEPRAFWTAKPIALGVSPVVGAFLGWYILKESMPPIKVAGIALMIAGLVMVAISGKSTHAQSTTTQPPATSPNR
jgi:drug/metabolite transporter (DMT)-like permease